MRRLTLALGGLLTACAAAVATAPAATAQETGTVHVVHGIPDTPVDVYVDGQRALDDFAPATVAGPVDLPAGTRTVALFPADAADGSGAPLLSAQAEVPAGGDVTLAAHLDANGAPTVTPFVDDVSAVPAGQARLVVRHTAAAPAVDVLANGSPALTGLTNPNQAAAEVPAGTLSAAVAAAGTTEPVLGPADLTLAEGTATFVHAIGSLQANNLKLVTFTVDGLHSAPAGVPAGAPSGAPGGDGGWPAIGAAAGLALIGAGAVGLRRTRAARS
ncbi:DUF4397 domain-containing protein [Pseudonocardia sp. NPDC049154]|uniref:DUF4397 domain-containing protein n=1 Tax=Pseudonocardia sp. NPDC049154 TaxID=3155501 RepID=UPI0033CEF6A1